MQYGHVAYEITKDLIRQNVNGIFVSNIYVNYVADALEEAGAGGKRNAKAL